MGAAPRPENETERLAALRRYMLLDTLPEPEFDRITALAAAIFDVPIALVSLVDSNRQWFKSCVGLDATETSREDAFCAHALFQPTPLVIEDATRDVRFAYNPLVTGAPYIRFYAGAPLITRDGHTLGTLCIIDREARQLTSTQLDTLSSLSQVVVDLVEARLGFRSREMFEKIADMSPNVMYLFDLRDKKNLWANRRFVELLGYPPADDGSQLVERIFHPDDAANTGWHFERMLRMKDRDVAELCFRVKDSNGEYRVFSARESVFERDARGAPTKSLGIANDITELRRAEATAQDKSHLLEAILQNAGEGILAADPTGKVTLYNRAATQLLGSEMYTEGAQRRIRHDIFELDNETPIPPEQTPLSRALRGLTTENREMIVRGIDEQDRYFISTGRPLLADDGSSRGGVVTFRDVTMIKQAQNALAALAVTDDLTQLPNKRALRERLDQLAREGNRGRKFAVVVTDVDYFKKVNDTYGHKTGDDVLAGVARVLRSHIRATDFVARYGGEEFVVLYTDVDENVAKSLADKLRLAVAAIEQPVAITASFGVCANFGPLSSDADALIKAADAALYRAKHAGRNRVVAHHQPVDMDR